MWLKDVANVVAQALDQDLLCCARQALCALDTHLHDQRELFLLLCELAVLCFFDGALRGCFLCEALTQRSCFLVVVLANLRVHQSVREP